MTSAKALNRHLVAVVAEMTGTKYCRACNGERPIAGGHKPQGRSPWRCARCHQIKKSDPRRKVGR